MLWYCELNETEIVCFDHCVRTNGSLCAAALQESVVAVYWSFQFVFCRYELNIGAVVSERKKYILIGLRGVSRD